MAGKEPFYKRWKWLWWVVLGVSAVIGALSVFGSRKRRDPNEVVQNAPKAPKKKYKKQKVLQKKAKKKIQTLNKKKKAKPKKTDRSKNADELIDEWNNEK